MMTYLEAYLSKIRYQTNCELAYEIEKTCAYFKHRCLSLFDYQSHQTGLLLGEVQSGKTSHLLGVMSLLADAGFGIFLLLTTDNTLLQRQTFKRTREELVDFCVCDENDYTKFVNNNMSKPSVIVLKKNSRILRSWQNNLATCNFVKGNPLVIVDDEADAASLNTLVNRKRISTINRRLDDIKKTSSSSIYLQVTGTPQAIILLSQESGWKPSFIYCFKPGSGYIGGDFFFGSKSFQNSIQITEDLDGWSIDETVEGRESLKVAILSHLLVSAYLLSTGNEVCNFLIHPSHKINDHRIYAESVKMYLYELKENFEYEEYQQLLQSTYENLKTTEQGLIGIQHLRNKIRAFLNNDEISIIVYNSLTPIEQNQECTKGINIIIGGNSLGRGVTIPMLQTIYYYRVPKVARADTMWQHARMFGYNRNKKLLRLFLPYELYKRFVDINATNNSIIKQVETRGTALKIFYPKYIKPTRDCVVDRGCISIYAGNTNYFPASPIYHDIEKLDRLLLPYQDEKYQKVNLNVIINILSCFKSESDGWNQDHFISFMYSIMAENSLSQGVLIVRTERDIARGTGTLLSPNDRDLGISFPENTVLTLYKVTGNKGWSGKKIWIPNIKLPGDSVFYTCNEKHV